MVRQIDTKKVLCQHAELENFLSGGLTIKAPQRTVLAPDTESASKLEKTAQECKKCKKCQIGTQRQNAVPGEGSDCARIVFVGEAPGADEDEQGRPFVGRAGKLLTKIITAMGLDREDVFICNILKCRPPGNRDPKTEEIQNCLGFLQKQLEIIEPEVIIALGAHAARTLLDTDETIGKLRGKFHEYHTSPGKKAIKMMATYHPAYLLRSYSPGNRRKVWMDMQQVLNELGMPIPEKKQ